jgi:hypothetical protein
VRVVELCKLNVIAKRSLQHLVVHIKRQAQCIVGASHDGAVQCHTEVFAVVCADDIGVVIGILVKSQDFESSEVPAYCDRSKSYQLLQVEGVQE